MKRLTLLVMPLMAVSLLTNCGERNDYLCFTAKEDNSSVCYGVDGLLLDIHIQKSTDGKKWEDWKAEEFVKLNTNEKIYVRNTEKTLSIGPGASFQFATDGKIAASGNVMSMIDFGELYPYCFCSMFSSSDGLVTPPELPATKLAKGCYSNMFGDCVNLVAAPALPATQLADDCYSSMFDNCCKLSSVPEELPATTLSNSCYYNMFDGCVSLTAAPSLPATNLTDECYSQMFLSCSKLKISENSGEGTKIFTCPKTTEINSPVSQMFYLTGGTYVEDPTAGNTYYWY